MSVAWKKVIAGSSEIMVRNAQTMLLNKCGCCPCEEGFYICTYCSCQECGGRGCAIGVEALFPDDYANPDNPSDPEWIAMRNTPITVDGKEPITKLILHKYTPTDLGVETGLFGKGELREQYECAETGEKCKLWAIEHTTIRVPFDGTIKVWVFFDGVQIDGGNKETPTWEDDCFIVQGYIKVGNSSFDGWPVPLVAMRISADYPYTFSPAGFHTIDMEVEFSADGHDPVKYTCRKIVRSYRESENEFPWIGDLAILPAWDAEEADCIHAGKPPGYDVMVNLRTYPLKGPFKRYEDALFVLSEWEAELLAWANGKSVPVGTSKGPCACDSDCPEGLFGADGCIIVGYPPYKLDMFAAGPFSAGVMCETGAVEYHLFVRKTGPGYSNIDVRILNYDTGETSTATGTADPEDPNLIHYDGILRPCDELSTWMSTDTPEEVDFTDVIGGYYSPVWAQDECTMDFEDFDYVHEPLAAPTGIPSDDAELADYRCWLRGGVIENGECSVDRESCEAGGGLWFDGTCIKSQGQCEAVGGVWDAATGTCSIGQGPCEAAGGEWNAETGTCHISYQTCKIAGGTWDFVNQRCVMP